MLKDWQPLLGEKCWACLRSQWAVITTHSSTDARPYIGLRDPADCYLNYNANDIVNTRVTAAFQCTGGKGDKEGTSERQWSDFCSTDGDIRGRMSEKQPKKSIKQHISHSTGGDRQVEFTASGSMVPAHLARCCHCCCTRGAAEKRGWPWGRLKFNSEERNRNLWGK